ncbi:QueT transporter family protein [Butyrivibrio sp. X503]|uniref:QueT transporter family protein n=1 Tax=Butyrivibrio sp. X503 TaxID=2364878 RepID=UPI000EA8E8FC|nr:QueT transporter family protein [Butyrivibrio sp. X503]RKM56297.1 QueT transporter family protein [Butyrivibrio sp. X503]
MNNKSVLYITQAAVIAAIYVVLTQIANALGLASGAIQIRFSEALTILPYFTPAAIPGLFVGCIIGNITTGCMPLDTVFGSIATLLGALGTYYIAHGLKKPGTPGFYATSKIKAWLSPVPPIVANTLIVPFVIKFVYGSETIIPLIMLTVFIGELISCEALGMLLLFALDKRKSAIFGGM